MAIEGIVCVGRILKQQLDAVVDLTGAKVKKGPVVRGYKIKGGIADVEKGMPNNLKRESFYLKKIREARC